MKNFYIKLEDVLTKKEWSYDLRQYVVSVSNINRAERIEVFDEDESKTQELEEAVKQLCNRCAAWTRGATCCFCGLRDMCDKYRTTFKHADNDTAQGGLASAT
jgi:hypothetical protein